MVPVFWASVHLGIDQPLWHIPDWSFESHFTITKEWKWLFWDLPEKHFRLLFAFISCSRHHVVCIFLTEQLAPLSLYELQLCMDVFWRLSSRACPFLVLNPRTVFDHSPALAAIPIPHIFTCLQLLFSSSTLFPPSNHRSRTLLLITLPFSWNVYVFTQGLPLFHFPHREFLRRIR